MVKGNYFARRGGYFAGSDWVPYQPGTLSHSTPTSLQEIRKQDSIKCPECNNFVPLKDSCIFCGADLTNVDIEKSEIIQKKHCPICNKSQDIDNSHCVNCNYEFNVKNVDKVKVTNLYKPKKSLFDNKFSDDELFELIKNNFNRSDYIKWDSEFIPKPYKPKLQRFFDDSHKICFSRLKIQENESIYYFADKKERFPILMLIFNQKTIKSNFKLYKGEVLILLQITNNLNSINNKFNLKYASKNKKLKLYYLSLGDLKQDNLFENLQALIIEFGDCIVNPLLNNYEFYEKIDLNDFII